jgi:hypothetical protein
MTNHGMKFKNDGSKLLSYQPQHEKIEPKLLVAKLGMKV